MPKNQPTSAHYGAHPSNSTSAEANMHSALATIVVIER